MRGDSIRDFYAKTLALLGLGVLAGTGALVDYWPSGVRLPIVESAFHRQDLTLAIAVPETVVEPVVAVNSTSRAPRRPVTPAVTFAAFVPDASRLASAQPFGTDLMELVPPSGEPALVPVAFDANPVQAASLGEEVTLIEPSTAWSESPLTMSSAPVAMSAVDEDGVIADVMKATKSSLVLTGRKTGASIVGAFRVVSDAVKRAMPN